MINIERYIPVTDKFEEIHQVIWILLIRICLVSPVHKQKRVWRLTKNLSGFEGYICIPENRNIISSAYVELKPQIIIIIIYNLRTTRYLKLNYGMLIWKCLPVLFTLVKSFVGSISQIEIYFWYIYIADLISLSSGFGCNEIKVPNRSLASKTITKKVWEMVVEVVEALEEFDS